MTLSTSPARSGPYETSGGNTIYDYHFLVRDAGHLTVIRASADGAETSLSHPADFTATGIGVTTGGQVTLTTVPAAGDTITILRQTPVDQQTDYVNQSAFLPETIETALDQLTMVQQDHAERLARAVSVAASSDDDPVDYMRDIDIAATATATHAGNAVAAAATASAAETAAVTKAGEAATSATTANTDRLAAETARQTAEMALDDFTDIYLGDKTSDPTTDNDGDTLVTGALYFNTADKEMRAYNAGDSTWYSVTDAAQSASAAAASASAAATSENNAGNSESSASTSAGAANQSAGNAAQSASDAASSESNAGNSESNAATSETNAATSETNAAASAIAAATSETNAAASAGVGPLLTDYARSEYSIATRPPSVVLDPVRNLFMRPTGVCAYADLVTHVRNSAAVFTDGAGAIVSSPSDTPRLDHHVLKDGMFQRAGLRVDTQATNLFAGSDDPAEWSVPGNMEVDTDVGIGSGGGNLFRMRGATGGSGNLRLGINAYANAVTLDTLQCFSFDARADGLNRVRFTTGSDGPGIDPATVWDVSTGDVIATDSSVIRAGIFDLGDGLFRCFTVWQSSATDDSVTFAIQLCLNTTTSSSGSSAIPVDPSSSVIVGNFQHEEGVGAPSSYIKTTTAAVTRAADTLSIANANLPDAAPAYTFVFEGTIDRLAIAANNSLLFWGTGAGNRLWAYLTSNGGSKDGEPSLKLQNSSGAITTDGPDLAQSGIGVPFKLAFTTTGERSQVVANGVAGAADEHAEFMPDLSAADVTEFMKDFSGTLSRFRIFDTVLSEAALITETTL